MAQLAACVARSMLEVGSLTVAALPVRPHRQAAPNTNEPSAAVTTNLQRLRDRDYAVAIAARVGKYHGSISSQW
jgi:hypothetical protein